MFIVLFFVLPFLGALVFLKLLKAEFTTFNVVLSLVFAALFGEHMVVLALVAFGVLFLKEKGWDWLKEQWNGKSAE